jgi:hypothetical protein
MRRIALVGLAAGAAGSAALALTMSGGSASAAATPSNYSWHGQAPSASAAPSSSSRTSSDSGTKETIVLIAHQQQFAFADANGDHKFDAPDYFIFREKDKSKSGQVLGFDEVTCHVGFHNTTECVAAATLAGGQVSLAGVVPNSNDFYLPIAGGTNDYRDATGQAHIHDINNNTTEIDLELDS